MSDQASEIIERLSLIPHPEGGHYRQTWAAPEANGRAQATCIYFLLKADEQSHWHRVDADEFWLWHAGDPLHVLRSEDDTGPATATVLGPNVPAGETPQLMVTKDHWQATRPILSGAHSGPHGWSLVSCVVSPGFQFDGFTLAAPGFDIPTT